MEAETVSITPNKRISADLIKAIVKNMGVTPDEATFVVQYNVITPLALAKITNRSISAIQNLMRPRQTNDGITTTFKKVYPHAFGSVFVLFDKNCYDYIINSVKK